MQIIADFGRVSIAAWWREREDSPAGGAPVRRVGDSIDASSFTQVRFNHFETSTVVSRSVAAGRLTPATAKNCPDQTSLTILPEDRSQKAVLSFAFPRAMPCLPDRLGASHAPCWDRF